MAGVLGFNGEAAAEIEIFLGLRRHRRGCEVDGAHLWENRVIHLILSPLELEAVLEPPVSHNFGRVAEKEKLLPIMHRIAEGDYVRDTGQHFLQVDAREGCDSVLEQALVRGVKSKQVYHAPIQNMQALIVDAIVDELLLQALQILVLLVLGGCSQRGLRLLLIVVEVEVHRVDEVTAVDTLLQPFFIDGFDIYGGEERQVFRELGTFHEDKVQPLSHAAVNLERFDLLDLFPVLPLLFCDQLPEFSKLIIQKAQNPNSQSAEQFHLKIFRIQKFAGLLRLVEPLVGYHREARLKSGLVKHPTAVQIKSIERMKIKNCAI